MLNIGLKLFKRTLVLFLHSVKVILNLRNYNFKKPLNKFLLLYVFWNCIYWNTTQYLKSKFINCCLCTTKVFTVFKILFICLIFSITEQKILRGQVWRSCRLGSINYLHRFCQKTTIFFVAMLLMHTYYTNILQQNLVSFSTA